MCYSVIKGNPNELWVALDFRYLGSDHGKYYIQTYVKGYNCVSLITIFIYIVSNGVSLNNC